MSHKVVCRDRVYAFRSVIVLRFNSTTSSGRTYSRLPFEGDLNDTRWFEIAFDFEPWERKNNGVVEREKEPAHAAVTSAISCKWERR